MVRCGDNGGLTQLGKPCGSFAKPEFNGYCRQSHIPAPKLITNGGLTIDERPYRTARCGDNGGLTQLGKPCGSYARPEFNGFCRHHQIAAKLISCGDNGGRMNDGSPCPSDGSREFNGYCCRNHIPATELISCGDNGGHMNDGSPCPSDASRVFKGYCCKNHMPAAELVTCGDNGGLTNDRSPCPSAPRPEFNGYCSRNHIPAAELKTCGSNGGRRHDGEPCGSVGRIDYGGVCDPAHLYRSTSPMELRLGNLRSSQRSVVLEYRDNKDVYTTHPILNLTGLELDHTLELQLFTTCFDRMHTSGTNAAANKRKLLFDLREKVVNQTQNLNFTTVGINKYKFKANFEFLRDYRNNPEVEEGLVDRMMKTSLLSRQVTRRIRQAMIHSRDAVDSALELEQPLQEEYANQLHNCFVAMKIKY